MATIKDNLIQMKNVSEMMVDLAYSAVFLRDKKLAEQVKIRHGEIKKLEEGTLKIFFKVKLPDEELIHLLGLMDSVMDIANAAAKIAELAETKNYPSILHDILKEHQIKSVK